MAFLLLDAFPLIAFASAIEPLRAANRIAGGKLFDWSLLAATRDTATAANGIAVAVDGAIDGDERRHDLVVVCAGLGLERVATRAVRRWLRRQARSGVALGAVSTGAEILARAGLLDGYRCTIHWENAESFREAHFGPFLTGSLYEIDRERMTSAGGTSSLDMMLAWIRMLHGAELAANVAEQFLHDGIRTASDVQQVAMDQLLRSRSQKLADVIRKMSENIESPVAVADLAKSVGLSVRQLERLFREHGGCSPHGYYLGLRLARARQLVQQSSLRMSEIAVATGFVSQTHFSKAFRNTFGETPSDDRRQARRPADWHPDC